MATYAISDLHGCLTHFHHIQNYLQPDDTLYVLGDCVDRGPEPWRTLVEVVSDPRCIVLKGNHEDMLYRATSAHDDSRALHHYFSNGGERTYNTFIQMSAESQERWRNYIANMPVCASYLNASGINIFLSHSGADEYATEEELLWDRESFFHWGSSYDLIIHGHTPTPFLHRELSRFNLHPLRAGALWYEQDRKADIDLGTVWTDYAVLLNLDTFQEVIFDSEGIVENPIVG